MSVLTSRDIKPNHLLAFVSLLPLFRHLSKTFCFTSTNTDLLIHFWLLANSFTMEALFCGVCCIVIIEHHLNTTTICRALVVKSFTCVSSAQMGRVSIWIPKVLKTCYSLRLLFKVMPGFN